MCASLHTHIANTLESLYAPKRNSRGFFCMYLQSVPRRVSKRRNSTTHGESICTLLVACDLDTTCQRTMPFAPAEKNSASLLPIPSLMLTIANTDALCACDTAIVDREDGVDVVFEVGMADSRNKVSSPPVTKQSIERKYVTATIEDQLRSGSHNCVHTPALMNAW
jgi:hypothetical protein